MLCFVLISIATQTLKQFDDDQQRKILALCFLMAHSVGCHEIWHLMFLCFQAVGAAAKQGLLRNAANTICHVKRLLARGPEEPEVQAAISNGPVKVL